MGNKSKTIILVFLLFLKMVFMKKINWFNFFTLLFSVIAIVVSVFSYQISKQSLEYEVEKDSFMNTPAITESLDSTLINFTTNTNADLQALAITFPKVVSNKKIEIFTKPIQLSKVNLRLAVENYIDTRVIPRDSFITVGTISIPVILEYSVIVFGQSQFLRENRAFLFNVVYEKGSKEIEFANSFLVNRLGYPLKGHTFFRWPFSKPLHERVRIQDSIDVESLLSTQLLSIKRL